MVPTVAQDLDRSVVQLHSAEYRTPAALPPGRVLIVGGGNTGYQLADELVRSHEVHLAVGTKQTPLPQRLLGRDLFGFLHATGLMYATVDSRIGKRMRHRETLIGSSPRGARKAGVQLHPRATAAAGRTIFFRDGSSVDADAVIWATGFHRDHTWIDAPAFDDAGEVLHERGVTPSRGLYFLGMPWQHTRGSALLGWVKDDAAHIADQVEALLLDRREDPT